MTNMLSVVLKENKDVNVMVHKLIEERFISSEDTVMVVDCINHICEEVYDSLYTLEGVVKFVRVTKDLVVFTNSSRSIEDLDNELTKYRAIKDGNHIYDVEGVVVDGEDAVLWYNALWDEGDVRKNIPYIAEYSEYSVEELESLDDGTIAEIFWDAWYNA